ncbi:MAG: hypothetical protein ABSC05_38910 [Candidatus Solibacter sp.]
MERGIPRYRQYLRIRPEASDVRSNLGAALASRPIAGSARD